MFEHLDICVVCGSKEFSTVFAVKDFCLTGVFLASATGDGIRTPLTLQRCMSCGHVQMGEKVDRELMFRKYWYRSGTTGSMRSHLMGHAAAFVRPGDRVLDIGCNDGTFLSFARSRGAGLIAGVDPSDAIHEVECLDALLHNGFFDEGIRETNIGSFHFDLITSFSVFYDIVQARDALRLMDELLAPSGRIIIEVNYALSFFEHGNVDMLGQEHINYYFVNTFKRLLQGTQLTLNSVSRNEMNGGNVVFEISRACHEESCVRTLLDEEKVFLRHFSWSGFERSIKEDFARFRTQIERLVAKGKIVSILGASTRGAFVAQLCDLNASLIRSAWDLQLNKVGLQLPGTDIPIVLDGTQATPDFFIVMPYQFRREIIEKYLPYLKSGGRLIFYRTTFEVVSFSDGALHAENFLRYQGEQCE